jgi:hypothetical protein
MSSKRFSIRKIVLTGLAVVAIGTLWHPKTTAQEKPAAGVGVVTVFDHAKLDASFAKAISSGGSDVLWSRASGQGTYSVSTHNRESVKAACKPDGCSHTGYTAVVYVVSGAATLVIGGTARATAPDKFGGQSIQAANHIASARATFTSFLLTPSIGTRTCRRRSNI